jgi:hypothetical protein
VELGELKMEKLVAWARQPTTVAGISALICATMAVALKQASLTEAMPLITGAFVSMILPDNSGARK